MMFFFFFLILALDPKPYIRTFEAVLHELERLQSQVSKTEENAAIDVKNSELKHCQNIITSSQKIATVLRDFGALDDTVGDISTATSMLNGRLEKLSLQYEKSVESSFLINSYLNLNKRGSSADLEKLWDSNIPSDKRKCANVVRQLQVLSRKLEDVDNGERARDTVDKFAEKLERDLLNDFDNAYRSADLVAMKESADVLTDFNGGSSVVQMFVNQHDYFIVQENLVDALSVANEEMWAKICDPEGDVGEFEDTMKKMVDGMEDVIMQELEIIKKVFRDPVIILKVFLQRVFAQKIQLQIEAYLKKAESLSSLAYMRTLHIGYSKIGLFTTSLKASFSRLNIDANGELAALLDQNFADIFVPYIENGQYFEAETKSLGEIITQAMASFTEAHTHKFIREQSLLSRFTSSGDTSKLSEHHLERHGSHGSVTTTNKDKETGRIGQLIRAVGLERANSERKSGGGADFHPPLGNGNGSTNGGPIGHGNGTLGGASGVNGSIDGDYLNPDDREIKSEMVQRILSSMAESVKRDLELAEQSQIPGHARTFLHMLIESLGKNCIDIVLEEALQLATSQEGKSSVDLGYLKDVREAGNTIMLMSSMIKTVIFPMVSSNSPQMRTIVTTMVNVYLERVEGKINRILLVTIDASVARLGYQLSKQKKKDFIPKEDSIDIVQQSVVCSEVTIFLATVHKSALAALESENLELLLEEIGLGFRDALLDHFKKFAVNRTGGRIVAQDIEQYREAIDKWGSVELSAAFSVLEGISELFTVKPQDVVQLVRTSPYISQVKLYIIREYMSKRTDYVTASINKMLNPANGINSTARSQSHVIIPAYPLI